ncbi:MAG: hypothetical protein GXP63_05635, partial [DPANN group archaeon]|nr:hypothetical protein [DPANN group archaeon]
QAKEAREYVDRLIAEATKNKPTSNVEDITGQAIAELTFDQGIPSLPGYYYLKPSFSFDNPSGIDRYPLIYRSLSGILLKCAGDTSCIQSALGSLQTNGLRALVATAGHFMNAEGEGGEAEEEWTELCEPVSERPLHDFLAFYQDCALSLDGNCACTADASDLWDAALDDQGSSITISFSPVVQIGGGKTGQNSKDRYLLTMNHGESSAQIAMGELSQIPQEYTLSSGQVEMKTDTGTISSSALVLEKTSAPGASSRMRFISAGETAGIDSCSPSSFFRVCVEDQGTLLFLYDPEKNDLVIRHPVIRFALQNIGVPPPSVSKIKAVDAFREEGAIVVSWPHIDDPNVIGYVIYYSHQNLGLLSNEEIRKQATTTPTGPDDIGKQTLRLDRVDAMDGRIQLQNLGLKTECAWDYAKATCSYTTLLLDAHGKPTGKTKQTLLQKATPYLFHDEQMVYLLPADDGQPLYVTVLALAPNGMESPDRKVKGQVISTDDYPPPPCEHVLISSKGTPPNAELDFSCSFSERPEDVNGLFIDYRITDTDGQPVFIKPLKPLPFVQGQLAQSGKLPMIRFQDTEGQPIRRVAFRILARQDDNDHQEGMYDQTYPLDAYEPLQDDWLGILVEAKALSP